MLGHSKISRSLVAAAAALMMSTVAVGAAVAPAQAVVTPVSDAVETNFYA